MVNNQNQQKFKIWWDGTEKVIRICIFGEQDEESAEKIKSEASKLIASLREKGVENVCVLADMTKAGQATSKARIVFAHWFQEGTIDKIALFGGEAIQRTIAKFIFAFSSYKNAKYFDTEEEALKWLQ